MLIQPSVFKISYQYLTSTEGYTKCNNNNKVYNANDDTTPKMNVPPIKTTKLLKTSNSQRMKLIDYRYNGY